jgi:hypothetical protein
MQDREQCSSGASAPACKAGPGSNGTSPAAELAIFITQMQRKLQLRREMKNEE